MKNTEISGFIGRLRNKPIDEQALFHLLKSKSDGLGIPLESINAPLPIECIVCFKPNDKKEMFDSFLDHWKMITDLAYINGVDPFIEALELAYALDKGNITSQHINNYYSDYAFISKFRLLHGEKIIYGI